MPSQRRNAAFSLNCDHAGAWRSERSFPAHRTLPPLQTMWEILIPCGSSSSHGGGASSDWPHRRAISALPLQGLGVVVLLLSDMQYYNPPPHTGTVDYQTIAESPQCGRNARTNGQRAPLNLRRLRMLRHAVYFAGLQSTFFLMFLYILF